MWGKHHESKTPSRPTSPRAADYSSGSSCPATGKPQPRLASLGIPPGQVEPLIGDGAAESARPICPAKRCRGESSAAVGQHDATRPTTNAPVDTAYEPGCLHTASADAQCIAGGAVEGDCPGPPRVAHQHPFPQFACLTTQVHPNTQETAQTPRMPCSATHLEQPIEVVRRSPYRP